ncbi:MAG TPA: prepilin-type N-terminal cleavage/methylation domain-containing protein [Candidatus Dormibacteraeota bacterium]
MTIDRAGPTRSGRRGQRGLTLIETLVTVAVLAIGVVGIGAGVAQTEKISGITQNQAQLEVSMRQFADWVRSSSSTGLPYTLCATKAGYNASVATAKSAGALTAASNPVVSAVNLSTSGTRTPSGGTAVNIAPLQTCSGTCPGASCVGDWGAQEITLQVSSAGSTLTRVVWKSNGW